MALRLRYVTDMGWLAAQQSDDDAYDGHADTIYCVRFFDGAERDPARSIGGGIRLTPVGAVEDSLTWHMLARTPGAQRAVAFDRRMLLDELDDKAAACRGGLWDMTRLVSPLDGSISKPEAIQAIYELLGMSMYATEAAGDADPAWFFLTTPTIKRLIEMSGIPCETLYAGRVSATDETDSYLCVARPLSAYARIADSDNLTHRRASKHVLAGYTALDRQVLPMTAS